MNASVKSIGRMAKLQIQADRNGWDIVRIEANESEAVVLFDRGRSPFGDDKRFGTSVFFWASEGFNWGHYDYTYDEAVIDYRERCNRHFPV
jgi:hypothetical protein